MGLTFKWNQGPRGALSTINVFRCVAWGGARPRPPALHEALAECHAGGWYTMAASQALLGPDSTIVPPFGGIGGDVPREAGKKHTHIQGGLWGENPPE